MIKKIKKRIRNYIIERLVNLIPEIKNKYNQKQYVKLLNNFKFIGKDFYIEPPYRFSGVEFMEIGDNFRVATNSRINVFRINEINEKSQLIIGSNVSIESNCHIGVVNKIVIGDGVMIASNVYISDHFHGNITQDDLLLSPAERKLSSKGPVIIHKNVWIGDSVCILPNVIIGENAIIGANSVVTKDVPANSVVVGVPAVVIKSIATH